MKPDPFTELYESVDITELETINPITPRFLEDSEWVSLNRSELSEYEGTWIAVYEKSILSSGSNGEKVKKVAFQKLGREVPDLYLRFLECATAIYSI